VKAFALAIVGLSLLPGSCFGNGPGDSVQGAIDRLVDRFDVPACANVVPLRGAGRPVTHEAGEDRGSAVTRSYDADDACLAALETQLAGMGFTETDRGTYLLEGGEDWSDAVVLDRAGDDRPAHERAGDRMPGNLHWTYSILK